MNQNQNMMTSCAVDSRNMRKLQFEVAGHDYLSFYIGQVHINDFQKVKCDFIEVCDWPEIIYIQKWVERMTIEKKRSS